MLQDDASDGEQAFMGKTLFIHKLIAWERSVLKQTQLLHHPNGVAQDLVITGCIPNKQKNREYLLC
jgi:hypothetical protein